MRVLPLHTGHTIKNQSLKDAGLRLIIGDKYKVEIGEGFSEEVLYRLMTALERVM